MNKRYFVIVCLVFLHSIFLTSCITSTKNDPIQLNEKNVSHQITTFAPGFANTYKTSDPIRLELDYNSTNEIIFPNDFNPRIFEETKDGWVEIKIKPALIIPTNDVILSPQNEMSAVHFIVIFPDISNLDRNYILRIYVIGKMRVNSETEEVAAFTDVTLNP
jgi:hypothetical protein